MTAEFEVKGLPLPALLIDLLQQGKWQHPGEKSIREVIPFLHDRVIFLESVKGMQSESSNFIIADDPQWSELFHEVRGSRCTTLLDLPWLDIEKAVFVAVNLEIGADVAIALDYRTSTVDPRVVASEWLPDKHLWREVTPTFSQFVERLGIGVK